MMKTAFPYWDNRIAPVFDTARQIDIVEIQDGQIITHTQEMLLENLPVPRILRLVELGINSLVCGAISRPVYELITAYGIQVIPFVAGDLDKVIQAWLHGNLQYARFAMPGCRKCGFSRFGKLNNNYKEEKIMNGKGQGMGAGAGKGRGQGSRRAGRRGGPLTAGPTGYCVCPQCGHRESHARGMPCYENKCPKCGIPMTRQ